MVRRKHNNTLKYVPAFGLHRTPLRQLSLALCVPEILGLEPKEAIYK